MRVREAGQEYREPEILQFIERQGRRTRVEKNFDKYCENGQKQEYYQREA